MILFKVDLGCCNMDTAKQLNRYTWTQPELKRDSYEYSRVVKSILLDTSKQYNGHIWKQTTVQLTPLDTDNSTFHTTGSDISYNSTMHTPG